VRKEEEGVNSLDIEFSIAQLEKYINDFDTAMKKENKKAIKRLILGLIPMVLGVIATVISGNLTFLVIGTSCTTVGATGYELASYRKEINKIKKGTYNFKNDNFDIKPPEEKDVDQVLSEEIISESARDFYSEEYKAVLKEMEKDPNPTTPDLRVIDNNKNYLSKKETMIRIAKEIDIYYMAYKLPPMKITEKEWVAFFDTLYRIFTEKGIEKEFYDSMSELSRMTFAKALVHKGREINLNNFISNLHVLEFCNGIKKDEMTDIKKKIREETGNNMVLKFEIPDDNKRKNM
jgi:hypothetical protein